MQIPLPDACGSANFRNSEKGAFTKGALRKFLRKFCASFASSSFREGAQNCAQDCTQNWKSTSDKFMQIPLFQCPHLRISDNRPRKRKRTNRENPRTIPEQIGKIPEKWGKSQKGQKRTKKEGQVQIGKPPPV